MGGAATGVRIYTRRLCGYCWAARRLLKRLGVEFEEVSVGRDPNLRRRISEDNGNWPTLPMVIVGEHFVGGYRELAQLHRSGRLKPMLEEIA